MRTDVHTAGGSSADWEARDRRHLLHPLSSPAAIDEVGITVWERGAGPWLWDSEGRRYFDAFSGLANVTLGYGRGDLGAAGWKATEILGFVPSFFCMSNLFAIQLAEQICAALPAPLERVHFTAGGSEAVETAIKAVRMFHALKGSPEKNRVMYRRGSYHGVTYGALSATGNQDYRRHFGPLMDFCEVDPLDASDLEEQIKRLGPDQIAAFIAEPVALPSGLQIPTQEYWDEVRRICDKYEVFLILDEVITGFGRTGRLFGLEHWNVKPDLVTLAKGITSGYVPLGACALSEEIASVVETNPEGFVHGVTSSGHPVSCAVGLKTLEILASEGVVANASDAGDKLRVRLRDELVDGEAVEDVWGLGLLIGMRLGSWARQPPWSDGARNPLGLVKPFRDAGVLVRTYGDTLALAPPLVIDSRHVEHIVECIGRGLALAVESAGQAS